jgi:hypothetical protein
MIVVFTRLPRSVGVIGGAESGSPAGRLSERDKYRHRMGTWWDYRGVWSAHPWVLGVFVLAALMIVAGIAGTIGRSLFALFFLPGLAALFIHHLIVTKKTR